MKIKRFFKKFFKFMMHRKNKILCLLTVFTLILSMFTVFCSANTVTDDEENVTQPYDVYFPYPNFKGFSFNFSVGGLLGMPGTEGRVYNTLNYIYGFDEYTFDPAASNLDIRWADGFYFTYPRNDIAGTLSPGVFNVTSRLTPYNSNPPTTLLSPGDALLWSNLLHTEDIERYMTGDSITAYYGDYIVSRNTAWFATPYMAVSRFLDPFYTYDPGKFNYEIYYHVNYVGFNNFTGAAFEGETSYSDKLREFKTSNPSDTYYLQFNLTPYKFFTEFFAEHPEIDYLYITSSDCNLKVYDSLGGTEGSYFKHVNFYHYLITEEAYSKLNLDVSDYVNDAKGYTGGRSDLLESDFSQWITNAVGSFMSFEIFPGFSFSLMLSVLVGALMFFFFLRLFAGG